MRWRRTSWLLLVASILMVAVLAHGEALAAQLTLTWLDSSSDELGFSIERSLGSEGPFGEVGTTGPGLTAFADTSVTDGTTYCYRVRAFSATAYSDYSNLACGTVTEGLDVAVLKAGAGSGTVISEPAGIICGASCTGAYASGTVVTFTATPATGSVFTGWSGGACVGTGPCTVTLDTATTVRATFDLLPLVELTVARSGSGVGSVGSSPAGISCGATCVASYPYGSAVTLAASPAPGSVFTGWGGACGGTGPCAVTLTAAGSVSASFAPERVTLTVLKEAKGLVFSKPAGIACGSRCSGSYANGSAVTLTAVPGFGFVFTGWSGGGCTGTGVCSVKLMDHASVKASFLKASWNRW